MSAPGIARGVCSPAYFNNQAFESVRVHSWLKIWSRHSSDRRSSTMSAPGIARGNAAPTVERAEGPALELRLSSR